jgi:hypothetical protein
MLPIAVPLHASQFVTDTSGGFMLCFWCTTLIHSRLNANTQEEVRRSSGPSHQSTASYPSSFIIFFLKIPLPAAEMRRRSITLQPQSFSCSQRSVHGLDAAGTRSSYSSSCSLYCSLTRQRSQIDLQLIGHLLLQMTCRTCSWSLATRLRNTPQVYGVAVHLQNVTLGVFTAVMVKVTVVTCVHEDDHQRFGGLRKCKVWDFHCGDNDDYCHLAQPGRWLSRFRRNLPPISAG